MDKDKIIKEYMRKLAKKSVEARAKKYSPEERSAIARKAVEKRWTNERAKKAK